MKIVHSGTEIISSFSLVDDDGNLVQNFVLKGDPNKKEGDVLLIKVLNEDSFVNAFKAISNAKIQLQNKVDEKVESKEKVSTEKEPKKKVK